MTLEVRLVLICVGLTFISAAWGPITALVVVLDLAVVLILKEGYLHFTRRESNE